MFEIFSILACCCVLALAMYVNRQTAELLTIMELTSETFEDLVNKVMSMEAVTGKDK